MMARILVVDDRSSARDLLEAILRPSGYDVVQAEDAREALAQLRSGSFDLLITDILMPTIDGYELARTVKEDPPSMCA